MADINAAIAYVLRNEDSTLSGKVTTDQGGMTRFGIAQRFHPTLDPTFYTCPTAEALILAEGVYASEYAAPLMLGDILSQPIANKLLDIGVNCGLSHAAKFAQQGVTALGVPVVVDGQMGPTTVAAINRVDPGALMASVISSLIAYYMELAKEGKSTPPELQAWLTRAKKAGI